MALGNVTLALGISDKQFKSDLGRAQNQFKSSVGQMKTMMIAAAIGSYLMTGANAAIDATVDQMYAKMNLMDQGLSELEYDGVALMAEQFELLGSNAEVAQLKMTEFIVQGKSVGLKELGIYLTKDQIAMAKSMTTAERYQFILSEFPDYLNKMSDTLPEGTKNMLEMRKTMEDLREVMGTVFLTTIDKLIDGFGGIGPVLMTAISLFTAYKSAMIIGNVAIGISKAIAMGGVFAAPVALAMGAAALISLGALVGGASLAIGAIGDLPPATTGGETSTETPTSSGIHVTVNQDKYGQVSSITNAASGGGSSSIQTNYGSK